MDLSAALAPALHQFLICLGLAKVEIHVEGGRGWAETLPTWRWGPEWYLRITNGKPLTGYHLWLLSTLLLFLHLPLQAGWSWSGEARVLSLFFQLAVEWDFLWFALNPAYGPRRFRKGEIWWFRRWIGPVPQDYPAGLAASLAFAWAGGVLPQRLAELLLNAACVVFLTAIALLLRDRMEKHRYLKQN